MELKKFRKWFKQEVVPRWPAWKVHKVNIIDWFIALNKFDKLIITKAVSEHYINDEPDIPSIKKVRQIALELSWQAQQNEIFKLKFFPHN